MARQARGEEIMTFALFDYQEEALARPSPAAPMATTRRGQAGKAVDTIVHVMSSGEMS
jgi:hypothetical protein